MVPQWLYVPLPDEDRSHDVHEPTIAGDRPAIGLCRVAWGLIVQRIHEADVNQSRRPDHSSRLDEPFAHRARETEADALCRKCEQYVEPPSEGVDVVELLKRDDGVHEVAGTAAKSSIGHGHNDDMLFGVEGAGVEIRLQTENRELLVRHDFGPANTKWVSDELDDVCGNVDNRIAEEEQPIHARHNRHQDHPDRPGADGACRYVLVVVPNDGAHLRYCIREERCKRHPCYEDTPQGMDCPRSARRQAWPRLSDHGHG